MFNKSTILSILLALGLSCSSVLAKPADQEKSVSQIQQQSAVLNINSADASALSSLPGIGIRKAEAIVEYRKKMGRFKTTTELLEVKGIGKGILAKLEGKIRV
ncbi:ComEA family DNA-binding protein [Pseudoalteromonas piscicida]|uniref:Helix-hairpin-helix domain-containing protein n=1 Tax=Pseudoalteromonas piscicida TaxID=43662 RepID=A0AAD0RI27_PSEO7|nr:helix-hairpin-helix domain-containing protein [Pseudoalteromonas piscicida]ASD66469.1 competence protein [Pseudoalteromonas piscicida]AXR02821.1 helix-hairpin-helix domain-containing protein [Pseudoalteromonas piscicida]